MSQSKSIRRLLTALGAAVLALALLAPTAIADEPAEGYEQFAGCPSPAENPEVEICLRSEVTGGHLQMGTKDTPITKPIVLSGGIANSGTEFVYTEDGGLDAGAQLVPGGIIGLTGLDWLVNFLSIEELQLFAVTELAGEPSNPILPTFTLPIKVHLINPVLGNKCYVGSDSNPINLNLTLGTTNPPPPNEPISGQAPEVSVDPEKLILHQDNGIFVDNAFAAPKTNGCELNLGLIQIGIDTLVSSVSGLPAPAGTNETVQEFDAEAAAPFIIYQ